MNALAKHALGWMIALANGVALAQFPSKPIHVVIPYSPGSTIEPVVRMLGDEMQKSLKQPVVIEFKPGASTTIGAAHVARAPADGHTLFVNAASFLVTAQLMSKLPYDPNSAFAPVSGLAESPHVLITPAEAPYGTAKEFFAHAQRNAGKVSYGSFGNASSGHLGFERLKKLYGFQATHVPYKGNEGLQDVMAGRLEGMLNDFPVVLPYVKDGKVRALAIAADQRDPQAPDIPTFAEATGIPFQSRSWFGILVRAETPPQARDVLNKAIVAALNKPDVQQRLRTYGLRPTPSTPQAFAEFMAQEKAKLAEAIAFANVRME